MKQPFFDEEVLSTYGTVKLANQISMANFSFSSSYLNVTKLNFRGVASTPKISKMVMFSTIAAKLSILDVFSGPGSASALYQPFKR